MSADTRLDQVLAAIDKANSADPNTVRDRDVDQPAELIYGQRMSATLNRLCSSASDHLQIAVRAQHIERWTCPRSSYPDGRTGYLTWRSDLKAFHARRAGELMRAAGYQQADIDRVGILIGKKGIKRDAEVQALEDIVCLVFLEHYAADFIAKHDDEKVSDILHKTARKMSAKGISAAAELPLTERLERLLTQVLARSA